MSMILTRGLQKGLQRTATQGLMRNMVTRARPGIRKSVHLNYTLAHSKSSEFGKKHLVTFGMTALNTINNILFTRDQVKGLGK